MAKAKKTVIARCGQCGIDLKTAEEKKNKLCWVCKRKVDGLPTPCPECNGEGKIPSGSMEIDKQFTKCPICKGKPFNAEEDEDDEDTDIEEVISEDPDDEPKW